MLLYAEACIMIMKNSKLLYRVEDKIRGIKEDFYISLIKKIFSTKFGRGRLINNLEGRVYKNLIEKNESLPEKVNIKKYQFLMAMLESTKRNVDKGFISRDATNRLIDTLVKYGFTNKELMQNTKETFKEKHGIYPPSFVVLSPTQRCNLNCTGCYASSKIDAPTLPYKVIDKIIDEVYNEWGNRFMTISGGEPLIYKDGEKTIFDVWEKYKEMFFLFYTNGFFIDREKAERLAKLGNVTPAISVEGFEKETDKRRGVGVFKRILKSMENLRNSGVPFGVSVTATSENADVLLQDKFYDFFFDEQGSSYMWMFQLMPIGQAKDMKNLMINPEQRLKLYRNWENLLENKKYCIADFWNSAVLSNGCIAYGRHGGYLHIDWNGNIMPCVFIPYYQDNIINLHKQNKKLADALFSDLFVNGRKWQGEYGLNNPEKPDNWLMPCSIRDHYHDFKHKILPGNAKAEDESSRIALTSEEYERTMDEFDNELKNLTRQIWEKEYLEENL